MTSTGDADDVGLLLDEAAYRLRCARKYDPLDDPRVLCENAHDAIEFSLNAVIVATGKPYRRRMISHISRIPRPVPDTRCRRPSRR